MSFQRIAGENNTTKDYRDSFSHYYMPGARIKVFNVLIDRKTFFDLPLKNEEEAYEKIINMSNDNDCTTGNLLDLADFKKNYRLIAIDLIKETKLKDPQQISFIVKLLNRNRATISLSLKNQKKLLLIFHKILPQSYE